jgi:CRISPR-associated protein Csm1
LLKHYYGQVSISLSSVAAAPAEFEADNFVNLWERLAKAAEAKKYRKLPLSALGVQTNYLDSFDNRLGICPFCGKRAADPATVGELYLGDNEAACLICRDQIRIGAALVKSDSLAILAPNANFPGNRLKEPLFGKYQLAFDLKQDVATTLANKGQLLRHFALLRPATKTITGLTTKVVSGYVPTYNQADAHDLRLQDEDSFEVGDAKTFNHIACIAKDPDTLSGVKALGVLKADVDNLGKIFACGLPEGRYNLSRLATFSRQLNNFFSLYLPDLLASDIRFQNIYTVFAGGDDLFLIGPWNRIIIFAEELQKRFNQFACNNNAITISVGISINKPGIPVPTLADQSEQALTGQAKKQGRNRLSLFGKTVTWSEFRQLQQIKDKLEAWQAEGIVGKALLYQMNEFTQLAGMEKQIKSAKRPINLEDMSCLGWRARLTYSATRNIGKGLERGSRQTAVDTVLQEVPLWLTDFDSKFKIALWQVLYNQR